jgi:hypothetical protein
MVGGFVCLPCGGDEQPCCDDDCGKGLACINEVCTDECGAPTLGCCDGTPACAEGFICSGQDCAACGQEAGQPCCDENSEDECREGLLCDASLCESCGEIGIQCCANATCPGDGTCINGTCEGAAAIGSTAPTMGGIGMATMAVFLTAIGALGMRRRRKA